MANNIELVTKQVALLDAALADAAKSSVFVAGKDEVRFTGAKTVELFELEMSGLGNYDKSSGYSDGDVTGAWVPYTLSADRSKRFNLDAMDCEESLEMPLKVTGEFLRTKVAPELDAYRFSKIATAEGVSGDEGTITTSADAKAALDAAEVELAENHVPASGRYLVCTPAFKKLIENYVERYANSTENGVSYILEFYNKMPIIEVASDYLKTEYTFSDDGFEAKGTAAQIYFMIVWKPAVMAVVKHNPLKIFGPANNQFIDGTSIDYRLYHDCFVKKNSAKGIYVYTKE